GNLAVTKRVTVTRLIAGGVVGGLLFQKKQTHDSRELYLLVEGPGWATMAKCDPNAGAAVRQFAQQINVAAHSAATWAEERAKAIERAQGELSRVREDTTLIADAKRRLYALEPPPLPPSVRVT